MTAARVPPVQEMRRFTPPDYLARLPAPPAPTFGGSAVLAAEYERVAAQQRLQAIDTSRCGGVRAMAHAAREQAELLPHPRMFHDNTLTLPHHHLAAPSVAARYAVPTVVDAEAGKVQAWRDAVAKARMQLEHQHTR